MESRHGAVWALAVVLAADAAAMEPSRDVTRYALFAVSRLSGASFTVEAGDVGVNAGLLHASRALTGPGARVVADTTSLGGGSRCATLFANRDLVPAAGCSGAVPFRGPLVDDVAGACGLPDDGGFPECDPRRAVRVAARGALHLAPGAYGAALVEGRGRSSGGTLLLRAGAYVFCSLRAMHGAEIRVDASAAVYVVGDLRLDSETTLAPAGPPDARADIQLFALNGPVRFGHRAAVRAALCAPAADLRVNTHATLRGTFVANRIRVGRGTTAGIVGGSTTTTTLGASTSTTSSATTSSATSTSTSTSVAPCTVVPSTVTTTSSSTAPTTPGTSSTSSSVVQSSTSTSRSTTSSTATSTSTTSTIASGCPSRLLLRTMLGTTSCGGAGLSPAPVAPFSGAIFGDPGGTTKIVDLGRNCLYAGGGGTATAPARLPDGPTTVFAVSSCTGDTLALAANEGTGPTDCTLAPAATRHCTRTGAPCTTDLDCGGSTTGGGLCNADPRCFFGPPLPVPAGPTSTCILNVFRADASGTVDQSTGISGLSLPLASYVYLTGNSTRVCANLAAGTDGLGGCFSDAHCGGAPGACQSPPACPRCVPAGTGTRCLGGKRHGQTCIPIGSAATTLDCPPRDNVFVAPLDVTLAPLGTGTSTLVAAPNGRFCPDDATRATCTLQTDPTRCQRTPGCFGRPACRRITQTGAPAGSLADDQPHDVTLAATFCIPPTGNALIDGGAGADLPGPGAVTIGGTFQTVP